MAHEGMPRPEALLLTKADLLQSLVQVDGDRASSDRALAMETEFRTRITGHLESLPTADAKFAKFNTSPFVLMFYTLQHGYTRISEIEEAILPAKVFSSMETSAGRMVEAGRRYVETCNNDWGHWEGDRFVQLGGQTAQNLFDDETTTLFWKHWQTVTGISVGPEKQGVPFSCSC